jgi:uncharacterized coiled-coil protein SlyX
MNRAKTILNNLVQWAYSVMLMCITGRGLKMARKGISYDQVRNAADAIKSRGSEPTITAVRVELGNQGSYSTISQHLSKWKDEHINEADEISIPPAVENKIMETITFIWNMSNRIAQQDISALKQQSTDREKALNDQVTEATEEINILENKLSILTNELTSKRKEISDLEHELISTKAKESAIRTLYDDLVASLNLNLPIDTNRAHQMHSGSWVENKPASNQST